MATLRLRGRPGSMLCDIHGAGAFPGARFGLGYPEAIGSAAGARWFGEIHPTWEAGAAGNWISRGEVPEVLSYELKVEPGEDCVDSHYRLTNLGEDAWSQGLAFNCFQCAIPSLRDHECVRHWVGHEGKPVRLTQVPRVFGPRPAVQLYSVAGMPTGAEIPFVANFRSTPADVALEPWMAIVSRDGKRLAATVSSPGLFLFQNREYSCIHSAGGFGPIAPGETGESRNRVYIVEATLAEWYDRMRREFPEW